MSPREECVALVTFHYDKISCQQEGAKGERVHLGSWFESPVYLDKGIGKQRTVNATQLTSSSLSASRMQAQGMVLPREGLLVSLKLTKIIPDRHAERLAPSEWSLKGVPGGLSPASF